jgi:hypothetical protein
VCPKPWTGRLGLAGSLASGNTDTFALVIDGANFLEPGQPCRDVRRRVEQRHGRAAYRAQNEREKNASRSGSLISCHAASAFESRTPDPESRHLRR